MKRIFFCPCSGWDCPHWKEDGACTLTNPIEECENPAIDYDWPDNTGFIEEEAGS